MVHPYRSLILMGLATAVLEEFFSELEKKRGKQWKLDSDGVYLRLKRGLLARMKTRERIIATRPPSTRSHVVFDTSDGSVSLAFAEDDEEIQGILEVAERRARDARKEDRD